MHRSLVAMLCLVAPAQWAHQALAQDSLARGRALFESQCSRCHGMTGGGAMGPSLRRPTLRSAPDDSAFMLLLQNGIPERGMLPAWQLGPAESRAVIGYVRTLGRVPVAAVSGDSARGRVVFVGKGACLSCHIVAGVGGSFGPELTEIGLLRGAEHLREALVRPGASLPMGPHTNNSWAQYARYLPVRASSRQAAAVGGVRVNEDGFTIQVRTPSGELVSLRKADLASLDKRFGESLMPSYAGVLSPAELDDVVGYLASLRGVRWTPVP